MAKFKFKDAAMTALGAIGGAYGADFIDDQIDDKIDDPKTELGVKLLAVAASAYFATTSKGMARDASIAALGQFGKGAIESAKTMMPGADKPTKGLNDELEGIYDEINETLRMSGNDATVTGNEAAVTGNEGTVTGASYEDQE